MESRSEMDKVGVYMELAKEHYAWDRHHEAQRSTICSIIIIFAGLLLSAAKLSEDSVLNNEILGLFIVVAGIFGLVFVYKQYERMKYHNAGYQWYRGLIGESLDLDFSEEKIFIEEEERYARFWRFFRKVHLHYYWSFLMLSIIFIGIYVIFVVQNK